MNDWKGPLSHRKAGGCTLAGDNYPWWEYRIHLQGSSSSSPLPLTALKQVKFSAPKKRHHEPATWMLFTEDIRATIIQIGSRNFIDIWKTCRKALPQNRSWWASLSSLCLLPYHAPSHPICPSLLYSASRRRSCVMKHSIWNVAVLRFLIIIIAFFHTPTPNEACNRSTQNSWRH